jgi:shikimate kinase
VARDTIVGLEAQLETLTKRAEELESTPVGVAYARIDELEDQREALLHEVRWAILSQREEVAKVKASVTWRVGSLVVKPLNRIRKR